MLIAKNDEEKRSKVWRFVTAATTIIIIVIVGFFITRLFTGNPLEGTWKSEDYDMTLIVGRNNSLSVKCAEWFEGTEVKIKMDYVLDKEAKTITIKANEEALKKAAKESEGQFTAEGLEGAVGMLTTTFDYSVEQNVLVLAEREYGEQLVFTRE